MWEEHPQYQKQQARMVGLIVLGLFALYLGWALVHGDWELLKGTLMVGGCFVAALGILSGSAWLLMQMFTRGRPRSAHDKRDTNG